ncbi:MAG: putative RNA methyltransferase [bacterium]
MPSFHSLRCPVCAASLAPSDNSEKVYKCPANHSFDVAREGYLNLLLAHKKKTADPGDNARMLEARRRFLEAGHYRFLPEKLVQLLPQVLGEGNDDSALGALDVGCGEGYYTGVLQQGLPGLAWSGLDISRAGIRMAARRYRETPFVVGSSYQLPFESASQSVVLQVFAPSSADEVRRVLKPGGVFITVNPAPEHLLGLKKKLYASPKRHQSTRLDVEGLELLDEQELSQDITLDDSGELQDLFMMTPFYWTVGHQRQKELALINRLQTPLAFDVAVYRRKSRFNPGSLWGVKD